MGREGETKMSETIPPPCSKDVYANGTPVWKTDTIRSFNLEPWVQKIAKLSGQSVDWHFAGGRAIVLALGDIDKVRAALVELLPEHDALWRAAARVGADDQFAMREEDAARYLASMREYSQIGIAATGLEEREEHIISLA